MDQAERARKTDVAACKLRYDGQITTLNEEMQSVQQQVARFRRERDTYKQMLDTAQGTIAELKSGGQSGRQSRNSATSDDVSAEISKTQLHLQNNRIETLLVVKCGIKFNDIVDLLVLGPKACLYMKAFQMAKIYGTMHRNNCIYILAYFYYRKMVNCVWQC